MVYGVSEKTTRELTGEMSELWRGTGLCRNTVLRTSLLTDTSVNTKKFFLASSKRDPSLCNTWGSRYITRTGSGSIQMCCFLASHALFPLPWMPSPNIIYLTNCDSAFRVQLTGPSSAKPFLTFKRSSEWKKPPSCEHLYYCTHQPLWSHETGEKIKVQRSDQPWVTQLSHISFC